MASNGPGRGRTPLNEVVDYLGDLHEINIIVDQNRLDEVSVSEDTPIELDISPPATRPSVAKP